MQVWLLFVLAAEAPAVAAQILCARRIASGSYLAARRLLFRMLRVGVVLSAIAICMINLLAAPAAHFFFPNDALAATMTRALFRYASVASIFTVPTVICESVLTGAGKSYKYLALSTLANSLFVMNACRLALARPGATPIAAWLCILLFFGMRLSSAVFRLFFSGRSGFYPPGFYPPGGRAGG